MQQFLRNPHSIDLQNVLHALSTTPEGLSGIGARERLEQYGPNEIPETGGSSPLLLLVKQFKSWLVIVLIIAAVISGLAGEVVDTWVIIAVVLVNAAIGFSQEYRAEKAIASLKKMIVKAAKVLRDGQLVTIRSSSLVPGDILVLEEGDSIAADARILESKNFRTMEASLTGESIPVSKNETTLPEDTALADRQNMVWKGTFVAGGYARAIVTGTGAHTAIGDISQILGKVEERRTGFMKKTGVLARQMSVIAIASAILIFLAGYFQRGFEIREILLTSIAALVAAVPEGLPAVISIVLAIGAHRMAKRNAITREFTATETLGAVTAILTDKTGTLTQNSLTVRRIFLPGPDTGLTVTGEGWHPTGNFLQQNTIVETGDDPVLQKLFRVAALSNNSEIRHHKDNNRYELIGDPTEGALMTLAKKGGVQPADFRLQKLDDLPFDSNLKLRATLAKTEGQPELLVTGAPEKLLQRSAFILGPEGKAALTPEKKDTINRKIAEWSDQALRVIALAYKEETSGKIDETRLEGLVFIGLVGMIDPPRPDSREAVGKCQKAGIRVVMVTGDHVNTAVAIARATGIAKDVDENEVIALTEPQLLLLDESEFDEAIRNVSVFARLTPAMKLRIAGRLQEMGHLIAMTGDGVNDAPALKQADVGISMGIMGTDVARDASDVVLADDNFATIVNAVEEGRIVFTNARQTSFFLVTTNLAESFTLLASIVLGLPLPLTATQILWLNLVTDGVTGLALATEPGHGDIMDHNPGRQNKNILNREVLPFIFINVILMAGLALFSFSYFMDEGTGKARTGVFVIMAFTQLFNVYNLRALHLSVFTIGFFSNRYINMAVTGSVVLLLLITEIPAVAGIFHFRPLSPDEFLALFALSSLVLWGGEIYKAIKKR